MQLYELTVSVLRVDCPSEKGREVIYYSVLYVGTFP